MATTSATSTTPALRKCGRCGESPCPVLFSGERAPTSLAKIEGWWVDGYGVAALAETHWEGACGREWIRLSHNHDGSLCVEMSQGARVGRQNVPVQVILQLIQRFQLKP